MGNINYNDHFEVGIVSPSYKIFTIAEKYDKNFISSMLKTQLSETAGTAERHIHYQIFFDVIIDPTRPLTNYKLLDDIMMELAGKLKIQ